jgi:fatty-acyl-CoA synthase
MEAERVTVSAGVPIIWLGLLQHLQQHGLKFSTMRRTAVGGSAMPAALIARFVEDYGVEVRHGWGMTETTAVATMSNLSRADRLRPAAEQHAIVAKQGRAVSGIEIKIVDENGATLPRDGASQGELMVRGQWIVERYFKADKTALVDGWFPTGDIAVIAPDGVMQIRDRTKDVIKTGGEWISSIDLENAAVGHPGVQMAAVIGVKHPKWDERPLLFIVRKPGQEVSKDEILSFLAERVAKWWVPDDVVFLDALPVGGTGKVQKGDLRKQYGGVFATPN